MTGLVDRSARSSPAAIDILVNNAGIIRREDAINFSEKDWDDVTDLNLKTVFFFSQKVAKRFIAQGTGGKIINIASMLSFQGGVRVPSYTASKSGVMGITRALANEWAKHGININAIAPGYMATDNTAALAKRRCAQRGDPGAHPGRSLGRAGRSGGAYRVPGVQGVRLRQWLHSGRRRRLAGALVCGFLIRALRDVREQATRLSVRAAVRAGRAAVQALSVLDELCAVSFTQYDLIDPPQFVGLDNYRELATADPLFRKSLGVTLLFAVLAVPLRVGFALFIAHVLNFKLARHQLLSALRSICRRFWAARLRWPCSGVSSLRSNGLVNLLMTHVGLEPIAWLADEHYSRCGPSCCCSPGSSAPRW